MPEKFQVEFLKFSLAQEKMNKGELHLAVSSFNSFLGKYERGNMRPNALLGKSTSLAGLGQKKQSLPVMQEFVSEDPNHPLVSDAKQVISEFNNL
jgi:outer membrane protein assembly factor BamD (BamD/ComL family)